MLSASAPSAITYEGTLCKAKRGNTYSRLHSSLPVRVLCFPTRCTNAVQSTASHHQLLNLRSLGMYFANQLRFGHSRILICWISIGSMCILLKLITSLKAAHMRSVMESISTPVTSNNSSFVLCLSRFPLACNEKAGNPEPGIGRPEC